MNLNESIQEMIDDAKKVCNSEKEINELYLPHEMGIAMAKALTNPSSQGILENVAAYMAWAIILIAVNEGFGIVDIVKDFISSVKGFFTSKDKIEKLKEKVNKAKENMSAGKKAYLTNQVNDLVDAIKNKNYKQISNIIKSTHEYVKNHEKEIR